jgi:hypothetical protein
VSSSVFDEEFNEVGQTESIGPLFVGACLHWPSILGL